GPVDPRGHPAAIAPDGPGGGPAGRRPGDGPPLRRGGPVPRRVCDRARVRRGRPPMSASVAAPAKYEMVVGLEVHVQLRTRTKLFCNCSTQFGDPPNRNTCPVCLALPGSLPVLNEAAVELATRAALALGAEVQEESIFARKNYFYPDLPKGYQISQFDKPLAPAGGLVI